MPVRLGVSPAPDVQWPKLSNAQAVPGRTTTRNMSWRATCPHMRAPRPPEQISCSSTPNEKMSVLSVQRCRISTSGAAYASVPPSAAERTHQFHVRGLVNDTEAPPSARLGLLCPLTLVPAGQVAVRVWQRLRQPKIRQLGPAVAHQQHVLQSRSDQQEGVLVAPGAGLPTSKHRQSGQAGSPRT